MDEGSLQQLLESSITTTLPAAMPSLAMAVGYAWGQILRSLPLCYLVSAGKELNYIYFRPNTPNWFQFILISN